MYKILGTWFFSLTNIKLIKFHLILIVLLNIFQLILIISLTIFTHYFAKIHSFFSYRISSFILTTVLYSIVWLPHILFISLLLGGIWVISDFCFYEQ